MLFRHKYKYNQLPSVCHQYLVTNTVNTTSDRNLRIVHDFVIPFSRTNIRTKSINVRGPKLWSALPGDLRYITSISLFKKHLTDYLLDQY